MKTAWLALVLLVCGTQVFGDDTREERIRKLEEELARAHGLPTANLSAAIARVQKNQSLISRTLAKMDEGKIAEGRKQLRQLITDVAWMRWAGGKSEVEVLNSLSDFFWGDSDRWQIPAAQAVFIKYLERATFNTNDAKLRQDQMLFLPGVPEEAQTPAMVKALVNCLKKPEVPIENRGSVRIQILEHIVKEGTLAVEPVSRDQEEWNQFETQIEIQNSRRRILLSVDSPEDLIQPIVDALEDSGVASEARRALKRIGFVVR